MSFVASKKTTKEALRAVVDDPDTDIGEAESDLDSELELSSVKEPDSGEELGGKREYHTTHTLLSPANSSGLSAACTPCQKVRVESGRTPFRDLEQFTPRLPKSLSRGSKDKSLMQRFPSNEESIFQKKKRFKIHNEQENLGSDHEQDQLTTNALLRTLVKRLDHQEKQILEMQEKI